MSRLRRTPLPISLLIITLTTPVILAGPLVAYDPEAGRVQLVQKADVDGAVAGRLVVSAKGRNAVAQLQGVITGVLFQATARPGDSLKSPPVRLSYRLKGDHDAVLHARIGDHEVTSDAPAWIWAVVARFADHEATAAVTLTDAPRTADERRFERRWHGKNGRDKRLLWASYHPALEDTLVGFMLLAADATIGDPESMWTVTNGLTDFDEYAGFSLPIDRVKSQRAARTLDALVSLEAKPGDCAMLNDVEETFVFTTSRGKLEISGVPNYRFARQSRAGGYQEIAKLTEICRKNRRLLSDVNPTVYKTVDEFSKLVAFFNFIDETDPEQLDTFVKNLQPVLERIPTMATPIALPLRAD